MGETDPVTGEEDTETTENADTPGNGTVDDFPEATGRDNMYHSYVATITPNPGLTNAIRSPYPLGAFDDSVLPISNRYVPLTAGATRLATTLTDACGSSSEMPEPRTSRSRFRRIRVRIRHPTCRTSLNKPPRMHTKPVQTRMKTMPMAKARTVSSI